MRKHLEAADVRAAARERWHMILSALASSELEAALRHGHQKHVPCPVHGGTDGFRLFPNYEETGGGICNTCGPKADGFKLLMWLKGWDFPTTLEAVASVVMSRGALPRIDPAEEARREREKREKQLKEIIDRRTILRKVWAGSVALEDPSAEPARAYLLGRGLPLENLPPALRFHPRLGYYEKKQLLGYFPALIALVQDGDGHPITIHRIFLDGYKGRKAPVPKPKKMMAYAPDRIVSGGACRLDPAGPVLAVTEGIETALAVRAAMGVPTWAAISAQLMASLAIPPQVEMLLIFADKDRNETGLKRAKELSVRAWQQGVKASVFLPGLPIPEGEKSVDWLDVYVRSPRSFPSVARVQELMRRVANG